MRGRQAATPLALAAAAVVLALVALPSSPQAQAQSQVALTASYSVVGGTAPGVADLLTYLSGGSQVVVPLTGTPTVYMADSGSQWSVQAILNGSTPTQRWVTASSDISGTIASPLTVSFSYYHQYLLTFNYNVTRGSTGFTGPSVAYYSSGSQVDSVAPDKVWVDAGTSYSYPTQLPGSSSTERWVLVGTGTGTASSAGTVTETYNHEFLVSSSYSVVGGGSPAPPTLSSAVLGQPVSVPLSTATQQTWLDAGANYSFSPSLAGSSSERWVGTVSVQTSSGTVLAMTYNGTVYGPISVTPAYYHQFMVNVSFSYVGGSIAGLTAPSFSYSYFGAKEAVNSTASLWVDAGTTYTVPEAVCCTQSPGTERWQLYAPTTGTVLSQGVLDFAYFHQYLESFAYAVVGQAPLTPSGAPDLVYTAGGNLQHLSLATSAETFWADSNSTYTAGSTLPESSSNERWFAASPNGTMSAPQGTVVVSYSQQYLITVVGQGPPSEWVDAGSEATVAIPEVFGRSQGMGYRAVSYSLDSGPSVAISQPALLLTLTMPVEGPHTISFQSVVQFQVALDAGASGGLSSITPPTVPGDSPWYDAGTPVQVVLTGAWGRHSGVGERIVSISSTGEPTVSVDTVGPVLAFNTSALDSPASITTTSVRQFEVALNGPALAAFSSISPPSTFPGDTFWYDAGSPAVTVTLQGAYSRSAGTGMRTSSWTLDSGPLNRLATAGSVTITTQALDAPQFINATSVVQYQLTIDAGAQSALATVSNPSIPLDTGWYDSGAPLDLLLNGVWHRSAGTGERLAGYSVDGGPEVAVASTGLVAVLNLTSVSAPVSVTTEVVAQYQVVLDSGAASSLYSITPTPVPQDKYWYDAGTAVEVSLDGVWGRTSATGSRLVSYSVDQGAAVPVLSSSPVDVLSLAAISAPQSVTTQTVAQFHLVSTPVSPLSLTNSTLPGDSPGWYDAGTAVKAVYASAWNQTSAGTRESAVSYSVDGGARTSVTRSSGNFTVSLTMGQPHTVAIASVLQYLVTVTGPPSYTSSPPSQTNDSYFDSGSTVAVTVSRAWNSSEPGVRDALYAYSLDGGPPVAVAPSASATFTAPALNVTRPLSLAFSGSPQYLVAFQFVSGPGTPITPSEVELGVGNATVVLQGTSEWLPNGTAFRVLGVVWEGANVGPTPAPAYTVGAAPRNLTIATMVYDASLRAVDLFGLPVSGAQVSMTLANGTVVNGTTDSMGAFDAGLVPLGTYTATVSSLGLGAHVAAATSGGGSALEARVPFSVASLFTVVVLAVGATTGAFLGLRWSRRRSPKVRETSP